MADPSDPTLQEAGKKAASPEEAKRQAEEFIKSINEAEKQSIKLFDTLDERNKKLAETYNKQKQALEQLRDNLIALGDKASLEAAQKYQKEIKNINTQLEDLEKKSDSFSKKLSSSLKESIKGYGDLFTKQVIQPITIGATLSAIPALDKMRAEFVKNTGASEKFVNQITKVQGSLKQFGIANQEASKVLQDVYLNFNRFGLEAESTNQRLIKTAGMFTKLGVPAEQFAKSISLTNTIFGTTTDQAIETQEQLAKTAMALNISIGDMNNRFLSGMRNFAVYGKTGVEQFIKLQTMAKATNVEMGTLQGITERLTTFEETGAFAGRLNAIVGQDLFDAVTLATLEGAEKADYIRERLREGIDFENISPQMMRAISKATGIEAADLKGLTGEQAGQDIASMQQKAAEAQLQSSDELSKTALRATSSQDKLAAAQEAHRNKVIEDTGALEKYQGMMGAFTDATNFSTQYLGVFGAALATVANIGLPMLQARLLQAAGTPGVAATGGLGAGLKAMAGTRMGGVGIGALGVAAGAGVGALTKGTSYEKGGNVASRALELAGTGAMIGSLIAPGIGTAIGGGIGLLAGGIYGSYENSKQDANDFVVTKDGRFKQTGTGTFDGTKMYKANRDDMVVGTKGANETAAMLKTLKELAEPLQQIAQNTNTTARNTQKSPIDRTTVQNGSMYT